MIRIVACAALATLLVTAPNNAQARTYAEDTIVHGQGEIHELASTTIDSQAEHVVIGRVQISDATMRMLAKLEIDCGGQVLWSTQNTPRDGSRLVLRGRYVADGPTKCVLSIMSGSHGSSEDFYRVEGDGTYLSVSSPQPAWMQGALADRGILVAKGNDADVAVMSTQIPADQFHAVADVEATNCYGTENVNQDNDFKLDGARCVTDPKNQKNATIRTKLVVQQFAVDDGYCNVTYFQARDISITRDEHHKKLYHRGAIQASDAPDCTDRYRIKVYLRSISGNDVLIHATPYTSTFVRKKGANHGMDYKGQGRRWSQRGSRSISAWRCRVVGTLLGRDHNVSGHWRDSRSCGLCRHSGGNRLGIASNNI